MDEYFANRGQVAQGEALITPQPAAEEKKEPTYTAEVAPNDPPAEEQQPAQENQGAEPSNADA